MRETSGGLRRLVAVLAFSTLLGALGLLLFQHAQRAWTLAPGSRTVPWIVLAALLVLADMLAVHIEFRGDAQTFSLTELAMVVGLFFVSPADLMLARACAALVVVVVLNRQTAVKCIFNTALMVFASGLSLWAFQQVGGGQAGPLALYGAFAAYAAVLGTTVAESLSIAVVVRLSGGQADGPTIRKMLLIGLAKAAVVTSIGLLGVLATLSSPLAPVLVLVVAGVLYGVGRLHAELSQRYQKLQQLYEVTQLLNRSPEFGTAARAILDEARQMLRSQRAELSVQTGVRGAVMRFSLQEDGSLSSRTHSEGDVDPVLAGLIESGHPVLVPRATKDSSLLAALRDHEARDLVMVPLVQGEGIIGAITVMDRLGDVSTFDAEDVKILSAFATHAGMALENARLIDELRKEAEDKHHQATHDALTDLANRTLLSDRTIDALARAQVNGSRVGILLMDLDRFKEINDTLGHHHGDLLLQEVARRLRTAVPEHATVARLGGDEFSILLPDIVSVGHALRAAEQVRSIFDRPYSIEGLKLTVTGSIGVAVSPDHGNVAPELMRHADIAMYAAKGAQQNPVQVYREEQNEHSARKLALAGALRTAIDERTLSVHYQPKALLATGEVVGVEALARWTHPEMGVITPDEFIPLAEHVGLIKPLTMLILEQAAGQAAQWSAEGMHLGVAVNLSAHSLLDASLPGDVEYVVRKVGLDPRRLTLEITESEIMRDPARTMAVLAGLRDVGVMLSIDDFGTGHSSLAYLKQLPVQEVKIDKSFVYQVASNDIDSTIVRSIVHMAGNRNMKVVAEGIEDRMSWDVLLELGVDIGQGYFLARPAAAREATQWLREHVAVQAAADFDPVSVEHAAAG